MKEKKQARKASLKKAGKWEKKAAAVRSFYNPPEEEVIEESPPKKRRMLPLLVILLLIGGGLLWLNCGPGPNSAPPTPALEEWEWEKIVNPERY